MNRIPWTPAQRRLTGETRFVRLFIRHPQGAQRTFTSGQQAESKDKGSPSRTGPSDSVGFSRSRESVAEPWTVYENRITPLPGQLAGRTEVELIVLESLILAQDKRWRRA